MATYTQGLLGSYTPRMTLDRYQELMQIPIAAFNGLNDPNEFPKYECATIWTQSHRDNLAMWLAAAEEMREDELGYHVSPKWISGETHRNTQIISLDKKHLIDVALLRYDSMSDGHALIHRDVDDNIIDPVIVVVDDGVTLYDSNNVVIMYPDSDVPITPSHVSTNGTAVTIRIPRSRLVLPEYNDDRTDHLYYADDANFLTAVDVKYKTHVKENSVLYVWTLGYLYSVGLRNYTYDHTQLGYASIEGNRANRLSTIHTWPATFDNDVPSMLSQYDISWSPPYVRISYLSGVVSSMKTELLTCRLAHTLMPSAPCSCPLVEQYWAEDKQPNPSYMTPYGNTAGAINAWMADSRSKIGIGGALP